MTMLTATHCATPARRSVLSGLKSLFAVWQQRQALRSLDARALRDIGVSRTEADAEAARPFWDAPATWHR
jgi:uncharacterized protein YjiS (DUF1127 family)